MVVVCQISGNPRLWHPPSAAAADSPLSAKPLTELLEEAHPLLSPQHDARRIERPIVQNIDLPGLTLNLMYSDKMPITIQCESLTLSLVPAKKHNGRLPRGLQAVSTLMGGSLGTSEATLHIVICQVQLNVIAVANITVRFSQCQYHLGFCSSWPLLASRRQLQVLIFSPLAL